MDVKFALHCNQLKQDGVTVLKSCFSLKNIKEARAQIIKNRYLFKNTRPTLSSGHLAGFHRFPMLESLHSMLSCNPIINDFINFCLNNHPIRSIGLSDITINRSQHWHTDLLRGKYFHFIKEFLDWNDNAIGIYKVLLYLLIIVFICV